jgi:hypothetical protein
MLSHLRLELMRLVRARPLVSDAVRRGCYSLGYSLAKGSAVAMTSCLEGRFKQRVSLPLP